MSWTELASVVASGATVVAAAAVVVTARIYKRQLEAMTTARQLESLLAIMKYAEDSDLRRARYFMLEHGKKLEGVFDQPYSWDTRNAIDSQVRTLSSGTLGIHEIDLALNALNNVCFLVRQEYAPPQVVDAFLKNSVLHAWKAFEPYVKHRRRTETLDGRPSQYAVHLEWVAQNRCQ